MIEIEITDEERDAIFDSFMHSEHSRTRLKSLTLLLKSLEYAHKEIYQICRISKPTLIKYLNEYSQKGLDGIKELKWKGQPSKLNEYRETIDKDFENNPPKSISEARDRIEKLTGIKRSPTQIQRFIKKLNYKFLKVGSIPGNGDGKDEQREEEREQFKKKKLEPLLKEAEKGLRVVLFMDAAHFIFVMLLGYVWCKSRCYMRSQAGRQRYNILGALNSVTKKVSVYTNETTFNAKCVCEFMKMLYLEYYGKPITIVLDNAKYQHCRLVERYAKLLKIELLFLPAYSPNLNLIERFWKYLKKKVLYSVFHENFKVFKEKIDKCISQAHETDKESLDLLLKCRFQSFSKVKILHV